MTRELRQNWKNEIEKKNGVKIMLGDNGPHYYQCFDNNISCKYLDV